MHDFDFNADRPALLVNVRSAEEAHAALAGGAAVINVKEPSRGPLGSPDSGTVEEVVAAVGERTPISAAAGELLLDADRTAGMAGVSFPKIGLAGCRSFPNWPEQWCAVIDRLSVTTRPESSSRWPDRSGNPAFPPPPLVGPPRRNSPCRLRRRSIGQDIAIARLKSALGIACP